MSNFEYFCLCQELQSLVGSRLDKLYDMGDGEFRFRYRLPGKTEDLSVKLGERIHITRYIRDAPKTPSNLAMFLRKRIEGLRLESIVQHDFDRVVVFRLSGALSYSLIFEMFAEGNLLLLDSSGKILRCLRREEWKDRILREGQEYKFPQSGRLSPPFSPDSLTQLLEPKSIISVLASKTNFGNDYLEEACKRAGIEPKKNAKELEGKQAEALAEKLNEIFGNPTPEIYLKEGKAFDYSLSRLSKYSGLESKSTSSFSEAVDECANVDNKAKAEVNEVSQKKKEKLALRLRKQTERCIEMQKEAEELKKKGDEIYARYQEVEGILKAIEEMRKAKKGWAEIKKALEGKCEIDEHTGKIILLTQS